MPENGMLAKTYCGLELPLEVLSSAAGFYIGTQDRNEPSSRESVEYWSTAQEATNALRSHHWTQKTNP